MTTINEQYKKSFAELAAKYGSPFRIPRSEVSHIAEVMRGQHVLAIHPEDDPVAALRRYQVSASVIRELTGRDSVFVAPRAKRQSKYDAVIEWCKQNAGEEVGLQEVADAGGFSYATASKFTRDRLDLFTKVRRGVYLLRNPDVERREDKR